MNTKKINCLKRLVENDLAFDIIEWLKESSIKLNDPNFLNKNNTPQLIAEQLYTNLVKLTNSGELLLVDYEWSILPLETIKITCVSQFEHKEFTYNL